MTKPEFTHAEAITAIHARIQGIWDDPQLVRIGILADMVSDILFIISMIKKD